MENNKPIIDKIHKIYDDLTYFDLYSSNIFLFVLLTIFVILAHAYSITMKNKEDIKADWANQRCKPQVIPFAGFINKPDNETIFQYTGDNFSYCVQGILSNITGYAVQPFNYLTSVITTIYNDISEAINKIRHLISNIRDSIAVISRNIMNRLMNVLIPLQVMLMSLMDGLGKVHGVLTTSLMTALGGYLTLQTLMGAILDFIIKILVAMAVVIVGLWAGFFTWPVAASTSAIFLAISIPLAVMIGVMTQLMHVHASSIPKLPSKPRCFDKNVEVIMNDGSLKYIKDIKVGDVLLNNNKVKAFLELSSKKQTMYSIYGVIVSGEHSIFHNGKWMKVKDCSFSKKINDNSYEEKNIYCLNTENKIIPVKVYINSEETIIFSDWDELYEKDKLEKMINVFTPNFTDFKTKKEQIKNINEYLDVGFEENHLFSLKNSEGVDVVVGISELKIDDVLKNGEIIVGIVKIIKNNKKILYNLLTDTSSFKTFDEIEYFDYNYCIDSYLLFPETKNHYY